ncbi:dynein regulatory complex protein 9-like [Bombyx mandarina]|uniref:Dynein regulatory complex protein 9 n=1 Tax=Bombyx mandarina TaxID=7092 RepID=A0A6J2K3A8_BOMMA|nr:dynein regulatory complex protein 9-like [Bombyx mandarina]
MSLHSTSRHFIPPAFGIEGNGRIGNPLTIPSVVQIKPKTTACQNKYCLKYLYSELFATAIEDAIIAYRILAESNSEMRIQKTLSDMPILLAKKYSVEQPAFADELDSIDANNLKCTSYKLNKLNNDRLLFSDILIATYLGLSLLENWKALADRNNDHASIERNRLNLIEEEAKNRNNLRELMKQYRQQRNHIKSVTYDTNVVIEHLKSQVEDSAINAEARSRYMDGWQRARTEQHVQMINDVEASPTNSIEYYKHRMDSEQRVHHEIELLLNIKIGEILAKVESWMNKYDADMEKIELKIQHKQNEHQKIFDKRVELEETLEKHQKLMQNWQKFKDDREEARLFEEKMNNAAVTVQSWWRGLLVRLELGPYKPVNKPVKPAEKKKKTK